MDHQPEQADHTSCSKPRTHVGCTASLLDKSPETQRARLI